jgi:hypothetical protein
MGSLLAVQKQFPQMSPWRPWNYKPPVDTDADIDQAIQAKINVGMRALPLLASADLVLLDPSLVAAVPEWRSDDDEAAYSGEAKLPRSPLFLDFEAIDGTPVAWNQDTWPFPFYLRGALCWATEDLLSIVPFGSVGEQHPWGGTDYQAWSRWVYLQGHSPEWPQLGPGDFFTRTNGEVRSWVDSESGSICAHQGGVAFNLCRRVLSVLMFMEALDIELAPDSPSRQVRRSAERKGKSIGLIPTNWPMAAHSPRNPSATPVDDSISYAPEDSCRLPKTHSRLAQCHSMWHEALNSYADPDVFVGHLNATIQGLRTVTLVLQKELKHQPGFDDWYERHQTELKQDPRMKWLVEARNQVEKQGDLDTVSTARVRVLASWLDGPFSEMDVDPTTEAQELARNLQVLGLPPRVSREGVLEVERRWTVDELAGDEILDVLAHCYGSLNRIVVEAHTQFDTSSLPCELGVDAVCEGHSPVAHPSGRVPCMVASRKWRTVRRNLQSGALIEMDLSPVGGPPISREEILKHYGNDLISGQKPSESGLFGMAEAFHLFGRRFLVVDGSLETVAWVLRDGDPLRQMALQPRDQREKYLSIDVVAEQVDQLGANEVIFSAEMWEAPAVKPDDERSELRPGERQDRTEAMITYALDDTGRCRAWRSAILRDGATGEIELGAMESMDSDKPFFFQPIIRVWERWSK